jgi:SNF2 family DNA or RNA helicase
VLDVRFLERSLAARHGARWDPQARAFLYVGETLPVGLAPYASKPWSWTQWKEDDLNGPDTPDVFLTADPVKRPVLRPYQQLAIDQIEAAFTNRRPGFLLADDVGLGKTYATIAGVIALEPRRVLVLAPLSVLAHWRRSITALTGPDDDIRRCVINYDRAKSLLHSTKNAVQTRTKSRLAAMGAMLGDDTTWVAEITELLDTAAEDGE